MIKSGRQAEGGSVEGTNIACVLGFDLRKGDELIVKTGISAVDESGAAGNLAKEMPGWNFDCCCCGSMHNHGRKNSASSGPVLLIQPR